MSNHTYRRGQIEWALWRTFARNHSAARSSEVPPVFRTRIKRLLDIDRETIVAGVALAADTPHAFGSPENRAIGKDAAYTPIDVFMLALGLDLLDAGFKQAEVVLVLRFLRPVTEEKFDQLVERPSLLHRQRHSAQGYRELPAYRDESGLVADSRMFLCFHKIELEEVIPAQALERKNPETPVILEPELYEGIEDLKHRLNRMPAHFRTLLVLEIAGTAQAINEFLKSAPEVRRGRPPAR